MDITYYAVNVKVSGIGNERDRVETIKFKSRYAARYMAKKYLTCADVCSVDVIDQITGEVIYSNDRREEWDVEG